MNIVASIFALALLGTPNANIVPEGMNYQEYLEVTFHEENILDIASYSAPQDEVVVYNAAGEVVAKGTVSFIGEIVDTQDTALLSTINKANFMMEMGNTRIYQLN